MGKAPAKLSPPPLRINSQKAHSLLDRRYAERVPVRYRVSYSGTEGARVVSGEGTLKDLSKTGCRILGSAPNSLGTNLTLLLDLQDRLAPMCLTNVIVTEIEGNSFAVRFPNLSSEERKRLQEVIFKHISLSSSNHRRTAFRIV